MLFHSIEWPVARDAEGGGLGGGGNDNNGASSDGAAGGFADAGNASASFDGSVSAIDGSGAGVGNNSGNVGGGGLDANANGGPGVALRSTATSLSQTTSEVTVSTGITLWGFRHHEKPERHDPGRQYRDRRSDHLCRLRLRPRPCHDAATGRGAVLLATALGLTWGRVIWNMRQR